MANSRTDGFVDGAAAAQMMKLFAGVGGADYIVEIASVPAPATNPHWKVTRIKYKSGIQVAYGTTIVTGNGQDYSSFVHPDWLFPGIDNRDHDNFSITTMNGHYDANQIRTITPIHQDHAINLIYNTGMSGDCRVNFIARYDGTSL